MLIAMAKIGYQIIRELAVAGENLIDYSGQSPELNGTLSPSEHLILPGIFFAT
jgi:hypothetical protein